MRWMETQTQKDEVNCSLSIPFIVVSGMEPSPGNLALSDPRACLLLRPLTKGPLSPEQAN